MNLPTLVHIEVKVKWILNLFMKWEWIEHFRDISRKFCKYPGYFERKRCLSGNAPKQSNKYVMIRGRDRVGLLCSQNWFPENFENNCFIDSENRQQIHFHSMIRRPNSMKIDCFGQCCWCYQQSDNLMKLSSSVISMQSQ